MTQTTNEDLVHALMHAVENDCDSGVDTYSEKVTQARTAVLARMVEPSVAVADAEPGPNWRDSPAGDRRRFCFGTWPVGGIGEDRGVDDPQPAQWLGFLMPEDGEGQSVWFGPFDEANLARTAVEEAFAHRSAEPEARP